MFVGRALLSCNIYTQHMVSAITRKWNFLTQLDILRIIQQNLRECYELILEKYMNNIIMQNSFDRVKFCFDIIFIGLPGNQQ